METAQPSCGTVGREGTPPPDRYRTIQIHPTLRCNLSCLHCYSSSAPHHRDALSLDGLKNFLVNAYEEGFNAIAVSGGEPFLYRDLEALLAFTREVGYRNTLASNGMLLGSERAQRILEYVDLIALSVDGPPDLHDYIRGQKGAFDKMLHGAELLRTMQKPFGFIHTVTPQSWESLLWLGTFAEAQGAKLLQLHPLEMHGRANETLAESALDNTLYHQIFILANYLRSKYADRMFVQLDLLHREYLREFPQAVSAFARGCSKNGRVSDLFDTLVVDETGRISPVAYGFAPELSMGYLTNFNAHTFSAFLQNKVPIIESIFGTALHKICTDEERDVINWNELVIAESKASHRLCA
ncbi:radical SAM protein [Salmonirosea aquatica]|uniref:Radical SAM protein n=1 Tax=Salmonirosea aquatica TaxID=2654236 RepID=A0A7C9FZP7_9BACT|nr:radical SAM protein [Cytophagaceae bacterium SJW1-29]